MDSVRSVPVSALWMFSSPEAEATGKDTHTYGLYTSVGGFRFEGAVGFNCHRNIIERAGYRLVAECFREAGLEDFDWSPWMTAPLRAV